MGNRQTPDGLPTISKDTVIVFQRDIRQMIGEGGTHKIIDHYFERMAQDNPELFSFGGVAAEMIADTEGDLYNSAIMSFCFAYELLRRQAEVDKLEGGG